MLRIATLMCGALLGASLGIAIIPARAQSGDDSATVKLIQLLIEKGILTRDQAATLLSQARSESHAARTASRQSGAHAVTAAAEPAAPVVPKGTVRVTYVPQSVRDQIASEVREQVLGEEQKNGWAAPNALPEWTKRITVYGDLRLRGERDLFDKGNFGQFLDVNTINNGSPFDTLSGSAPPLLNTQEDRTRFRLRARLGVKANVVDDWLMTDIRLATGNDTSPVTENQTLGQNGPFDKYSIWLDRAYARFQVPPEDNLNPLSSLRAYVGRMMNPFWTTNLLYADDLNFDGAAVAAVVPVANDVNVWATGGAFVAYNTALNYGIGPSINITNPATGANQTGFNSRDKYLFGGQVGVDWKATPVVATKFAAGIFDYSHVEGQLSSLCTINVSGDVCNTDNSRTQFEQFGNTFFPIRNINQSAGLNGTTAGIVTNPEYYGLASRFDVLELHGRVDFTRYNPVNVELEGEFVKNLAFNRALIINKGPINNLAAEPQGSSQTGPWSGGDTGYFVKLEVGTPDIVRRNQWYALIGYKYLESDAVLDAFTDSDFHLGGTNAKGYIVGAGYGIGKNTYLAARWLSANEVSGPRYRNDVVQVDLNTKF